MKDFEALMSIWQDQIERPKVSHEDVLKRIRRDKNALSRRLLFEMGGMALAIALLSYVWYSNPFRMWTTHLAMLMFMVCCIYYIFTLVHNYRRISSVQLFERPGDYIQYLKKYKHDRYIFNTRKYRYYSLFFTAAFVLYFIEIAFLADPLITIVGAVLTAAWIAFCYFFLMRIYIKKEETKLEGMIHNLERLREQFKDSDH